MKLWSEATSRAFLQVQCRTTPKTCRPQSAGDPSISELVEADKGNGKRPDDITVFPLLMGEVCSEMLPVQTSMSILTSIARHAAQEAERRKHRKYGHLGLASGVSPLQ